MTVLPHELGHILFFEGHSDVPQNIMFSDGMFGGVTKQGDDIRKYRGAVTEGQCKKARDFIDSYDQLSSAFLTKYH
jgi:hypothetical protein